MVRGVMQACDEDIVMLHVLLCECTTEAPAFLESVMRRTTEFSDVVGVTVRCGLERCTFRTS